MRIFYAAGPGDIVSTFKKWCSDEADETEVSVTYSSLYFDFISEGNHTGLAVSYHSNRDTASSQNTSTINLPKPRAANNVISYFASEFLYGLCLIVKILRFRANVAIISDASGFWFQYSILSLFGVKVIPSMHCVMWPPYGKKGNLHKVLSIPNKFFFRRIAKSVLSASEAISSQLLREYSAHPKIFSFLPLYRRDQFLNLSTARQSLSKETESVVLFVGRLERDKGVLDLLEICDALQSSGWDNITFDICGDGSIKAELSQSKKALRLPEKFNVHGHCNRDKMNYFFNKADIVIVPTRSEFVEGMNQVVVEAVLAGRPVISSVVCPAISYVPGAVMEAQYDSIDSYQECIKELISNSDLYRSMVLESELLRDQFYREENSWGSALARAINHLQ